MKDQYDFSGWATRNDLQCSDGRIIRRDAFKEANGMTVPLVWNHDHSEAQYVLGHALLENRAEGVYAYCTFNNTDNAQTAKQLVQHGDITELSIYANRLKQVGNDVVHGKIREVSLVLAGANPGAKIKAVLQHSYDSEEDEGVLYTGEPLELIHAEEQKTEDNTEGEKTMPNNNGERTVKDVFDTLNEEQKNVVYALIGKALEDAGARDDDDDDYEEDTSVKHNVFDNDYRQPNDILSHSEMETILADGKRYGSLRDSFMAHADDYGIESIDYLFPDAQTLNKTPEFISRDMSWVTKVMNGIHHTPFSRIKSVFANITEDEARAKGYIKGNMKKNEVFSLLKRTTTPTTIYKKQKLDRDDVVDITDFDVVAWLKTEMRMMLNEEIARAILTGDGRLSSSDDKINESNIRPIITDDDLYTIKSKVTVADGATDSDKAKEFIRTAIKARKDYKGSGHLTLFITEEWLTNMLLLEDTTGRLLYTGVDQLKNLLRVSDIVTTPILEGVKGKNNGDLIGVLVDLADYNVGADKGGSVNMFDDFDIDYNQQIYLIETRCSGALTKPYSAISLELVTA